MGGDYGQQFGAQTPVNQNTILGQYGSWLPQLLGATTGATTTTAGNQLNATQATQPGYNALNLQGLEQFAIPENQVGQNIQASNAITGGETNLAQLNNTGGALASSALGVNQAGNPNYYGAINPAIKGTQDLLSSINLSGLSPGEYNATERSLNQSNTASGNLGLNNGTNAISNAMDFGGAFNNKLGILGNALGTASVVANAASPGTSGYSPVSLALSQPAPQTMSNFGSGQFQTATPSTNTPLTALGTTFGSNLLSGNTAANSAANTGAYGAANNAMSGMFGAASSI